MSSALSIVIPTLNEARSLPCCLQSLVEHWPDAQRVVADGSSDDATVVMAEATGAEVLTNLPRGRGSQLRAGAEIATGDWLLFLHADSALDATAVQAVDAYRAESSHRLALFQLRFDAPTLLLRFLAWWTRFDSVFTRFGDQGILIRRDFYDELDGFKAWPLFEDVDLLRRARKHQPIDVLPAVLTTSARRFKRRGPCRQQLTNTWLLLRFLAGADPVKLAQNYAPIRESKDSP